MSSQNSKAALFGKKKADTTASNGNTSSSTSQTSKLTSSATSSVTQKSESKTAGITVGKSSHSGGLSNEAKLKKITEAREQSDKGMEALKTSLFQWSPDYLTAGNYFEKSSDLYKQAHDLENAVRMILKAAECHDHVGATAAVALAKVKAAQYELELGFPKKAIKTFLEAAEAWGIHGDLQRYADTMSKAASHAESIDVNKAKEYYFKALDTLCPQSTPKEQLGSTHPSVIELLRTITSFLVKHKMFKDAVVIYQRFINIAEAFNLEAALTKSFLAITTLYLAMNDPVRAQQIYLNEHLNNKIYMRSKDCELADLLILAFVNQDLDMLDKAKVHTSISFQDREIQQLIRGFSDMDVSGDGAAHDNEQTTTHQTNIVQQDHAMKSALFSSGRATKKADDDHPREHHDHVSFATTADEVTDIPAISGPSLSEELEKFDIEYNDNNYSHSDEVAEQEESAVKNTEPMGEDDEIDLS